MVVPLPGYFLFFARSLPIVAQCNESRGLQWWPLAAHCHQQNTAVDLNLDWVTRNSRNGESRGKVPSTQQQVLKYPAACALARRRRAGAPFARRLRAVRARTIFRTFKNSKMSGPCVYASQNLPLEVTLGSSIDTNLGHNHNKI